MQTWHKSRSFMDAIRFARRGLIHVFQAEANVRRQLFCFVLALLIAAILKVSLIEMALIVLIAVFIISLEYMNSALEYIEDAIAPEYQEAIKLSKDAAAGAVLVASIGAVVIAGLIFIPAFLELLVY